MIKDGSTVKLHYKLTVDGEVVDDSGGKEPLSYTHGEGEILPGLEEQLAGLKAGDTRSAEVGPEGAYGDSDPERIQKVPRTAFREVDKLAVGDVVSGQSSEGEFQARVVSLDAENVTLDLNHPLAGKTLQFEIEIVEVS